MLREQGQNFGIEAIRLGQAAESAGEVPDLTGVDDGDDESGIEKVNGESPFEAAGGFEDDEAGTDGSQMIEDATDPLVVIIQDQTGSLREDTDIESPLGDVDADEGLKGGGTIIHDRTPVLPMRARATGRPGRLRRLFGLTGRNRRRSSSGTASWAPRGGRSVAGRRWAGFSAALRSPPTGYLLETFVR